MIKGIGTDITDISRIKKLMDEHSLKFLNKVLSMEEIKIIKGDSPEYFVAGRFAAKEAIVKALGESFDFSQLSILNDTKGKPYVANPEIIFPGTKNTILHISISHEKSHATAIAIIEKITP